MEHLISTSCHYMATVAVGESDPLSLVFNVAIATQFTGQKVLTGRWITSEETAKHTNEWGTVFTRFCSFYVGMTMIFFQVNSMHECDLCSHVPEKSKHL